VRPLSDDIPVRDEVPAPPAATTELRHRSPSTLAAWLLACLAVLVVAGVLSIRFGTVELGWNDVIHAFRSWEGTRADIIVTEVRVPRTVLAIGIGAALGTAGALMQAITRNPLAEPGILGLNQGASLVVVLAILVLGIGDIWGYVWFAFLGTAVSALFVYALGAAGRDGATPVKITLSGAVVAFLFASLISAVLVLNQSSLDDFRFWVAGSLAGRDLGVVGAVAPFIVVGLVLAMACGTALNVMSMGDDTARALGQRVGAVRAIVGLAVVLLAGSAVAAAGPVVFVGLVVPHLARSLTGPDWRWVLPFSALFGALLLTVADTVGRLVVRPGELQVGVVTALVGAPFFLAMIRRRKLIEL
jgi:iron complex transport system permease protein